MPRIVAYDDEIGAGIIDPPEGLIGGPMNMQAPTLAALLRDVAIVLAVVVYVIDTL